MPRPGTHRCEPSSLPTASRMLHPTTVDHLHEFRRRAALHSLSIMASGKPVVGIRTANHAFSLRGKKAPAEHAVWEDFDAEIDDRKSEKKDEIIAEQDKNKFVSFLR